MKLIADDLLNEEEFSSPIRAAVAKTLKPLCHAWLSIVYEKDLRGAFKKLEEARVSVHEHFNSTPGPRNERTGISGESLRSEIFQTVVTMSEAAKRYDELDSDDGLTPNRELLAARAKMERTLRLARLNLDGWLESRTARDCRRYSRLLSPNVSEN